MRWLADRSRWTQQAGNGRMSRHFLWLPRRMPKTPGGPVEWRWLEIATYYELREFVGSSCVPRAEWTGKYWMD